MVVSAGLHARRRRRRGAPQPTFFKLLSACHVMWAEPNCVIIISVRLPVNCGHFLFPSENLNLHTF